MKILFVKVLNCVVHILIFLRSQVLALLFTVHFHLNINIYFLRKVMNDDKY